MSLFQQVSDFNTQFGVKQLEKPSLDDDTFIDSRMALIREEMQEFADDMNELSKKQHNKQLSDSLEWLEARGLDADFLPEPDGPSEYHMTYERYPGESHTGSYRPHYC
jgi:hypothetical protein